VPRREVVDYLRTLPEEDRVAAVVRALEIGVFALERAHVGQDLEFVKRQVEAMLAQVGIQVKAIPEQTQTLLKDAIGTGPGQMLEPIQQQVEVAANTIAEKVATLQQFLSQELDPTKTTSTVAQVLRQLTDLLDAKRIDSIQG
jgi:hypothetical protein